MNHLSSDTGRGLTGAAYIRVSTEDQIEYSPDSQLKKIREYANARKISLPDRFIYMDEGISGRSARKRPAFMRMIADARERPRPFDVILLWKFSRFARNRQDSIFYKSMLRRDCGIDVVSITEQLSEDPTSILIEALLEAMDEYYSINLAQEVKRGMNEKFSRGGVISAPPFGYRMGAEYFEPDEGTASLVPLIFEKFTQGAPLREIALFLNSMGIRTRRGRPFEARGIRYILSNPVYLGFLRRSEPDAPNGCTLVRSSHPPLLPKSLFFSAQERLRSLEKLHTDRERSAPAAFMLRGLVRCSRCGATLIPTAGGRALQCHRYARGQCGESHYVTLKKLNHAVLRCMEGDFASMNGLSREIRLRLCAAKPAAASISENRPHPLIDACFDTAKTEMDSVPLSRLILREKARLSRVKQAYEDGIDSLEEYTARKRSIEKRLDRLKREQGQMGASPRPMPETGLFSFSFSGLLNVLRSDFVSEAAKNEILRCLIKEITFFGAERTFQIFYRG